MKYFLSIGSNIEATKNIDFAIYELGLILSNIEISLEGQTTTVCSTLYDIVRKFNNEKKN